MEPKPLKHNVFKLSKSGSTEKTYPVFADGLHDKLEKGGKRIVHNNSTCECLFAKRISIDNCTGYFFEADSLQVDREALQPIHLKGPWCWVQCISGLSDDSQSTNRLRVFGRLLNLMCYLCASAQTFSGMVGRSLLTTRRKQCHPP